MLVWDAFTTNKVCIYVSAVFYTILLYLLEFLWF